jgi:hypothetical protein
MPQYQQQGKIYLSRGCLEHSLQLPGSLVNEISMTNGSLLVKWVTHLMKGLDLNTPQKAGMFPLPSSRDTV